MYKPLILIVLLLSSSFAVLDVSSERHIATEETGGDEPRPQAVNYIPFKEIATVVIDQKNDVTKISYSLISKDNKDFLVPDSLEAKILDKRE